MNKWLKEKVNALMDDNSILVDVGAYHGDFTRLMMATQKFAKAFLFEPHPENLEVLTNFAADKRVFVINKAVGEYSRRSVFCCDQNLTTGSLLTYDQSSKTCDGEIRLYDVELITLDNFFKEQDISSRIGLIKIDAQGYDLNVLRGAERSINKYHPWVVVELIFVPLYKNQCAFHEIFEYFHSHGYVLAGIFNMHYTKDNWAAYADAAFVPLDLTSSFLTPFCAQPSIERLEEEISLLRNICREALLSKIIHKLSFWTR